jgi:hypothetical protein
MKYTLLVIFILLLLVSSCKNKIEKKYYNDGKIKSIVELRDNVRDGVMYQYYPNGPLKSKGKWKQGKEHGTVETYYPNGNLETISNWINGEEHGISKRFTREGKIYTIGKFIQNKKKELLIYSERGNVIERQLFDNLGRLIYSAEFDSSGQKEFDALYPIIESYDTVKLGDIYSVKVSFGLPLAGELKVFVGRQGPKLQLVDTLAVLENENQVFTYSLKPDKPGENSISFLFRYESLPSDTLNVDGTVTKHTFYVKNNSREI